MHEKIVLITGGNAGIGKQTAIGLAEKGYTIVLFCRNEQKGKIAQNEIQLQTGNPSIDVITCDLSSLESVEQAANKFKQKYDRLDLLINNAGLFYDHLTRTGDGFETQFQVNHLSHFYLTQLLLDLLKKSTPARIVNVSSAAHLGKKIDFENLPYGKEEYDGLDVYGQTKLANILFTKELTRRLQQEGIIAFALHPGVVRTQIGQKNTKGWVNWGWKALISLPIFSISEKKGAETSLYAATSPELEKFGGEYLKNSKIVKSSKYSYNEDTARKLWQLSKKLLEQKGR